MPVPTYIKAGENGVFAAYIGGGVIHDAKPALIEPRVMEFMSPPESIGSFEINLAEMFAESTLIASGELTPQATAMLFGKAQLIVNGQEFIITGDARQNDDGTYSYPGVWMGHAEHAPGASWATKAYYEAVSHE